MNSPWSQHFIIKETFQNSFWSEFCHHFVTINVFQMLVKLDTLSYQPFPFHIAFEIQRKLFMQLMQLPISQSFQSFKL